MGNRQLSDLGNLTLPHSIDSADVPDECKPASISFERLQKKRGDAPITTKKLAGTSNLLKGLRNIPKDVLCVPHIRDLEAYWVECMKRGEEWNGKVMKVWEAEGGQRTESTPAVSHSRWEHPIKGLAWVRSWMLWRCKSGLDLRGTCRVAPDLVLLNRIVASRSGHHLTRNRSEVCPRASILSSSDGG